MDRARELTERFYAWEIRGRGWQAFPYPVGLEPPFRPFPGHFVRRPAAPVDDGRRETALSLLMRRIFQAPAPAEPEPPDEAEEPDPEVFDDAFPLSEITVSLPQAATVTPGVAERLLVALASCRF